jgi:plastocyanin
VSLLKYLACGFVALSLAGCAQSTSLPDVNVAAVSGDPVVNISSPRTGDRISGSSVNVKLAIAGKFTIVDAATATDKHKYGEGHIHLFLDVQPTAAGEVVPKPAGPLPNGGRIIHTTKTDLSIDGVPSGHHVLYAVLGYSDHLLYQATCAPGARDCTPKVEFDVTGGAAQASPAAGATPSPTAAASPTAAPSPVASAPAGGPPAIVIKLETDTSNGGKYNPASASVKVGDTVEWDWVDPEQPHTVTADDGTFDSGAPQSKGSVFKFTFTRAGTYPYKCQIHPSMTGKITVQ